jgi:V8-like Glu-specific endopeptidase
MSNHCPPKTVYRLFFLLSFIGLNGMLSESLQATSSSSLMENPLSASCDLRPKHTALQNIQYHPVPFAYQYDELTQIGFSPCQRPLHSVEEQPVISSSEPMSITAIQAEGSRCRIISQEDIEDISEEASQQRLLKRAAGGADGRYQVERPTQWPNSIHGHMIMTFKDGTYMGSGTMVGPNHVLTAAHNLYSNGQWASKVLFAPGRHEDRFPFGQNKGCILLCPKEWTEKRKDKEYYDIGMVILDHPIGIYTGWSGLLSLPNGLLKKWLVQITGYPGDKGQGNYVSTQMWTMKDPLIRVESQQLFYDIDTYRIDSSKIVLL